MKRASKKALRELFSAVCPESRMGTLGLCYDPENGWRLADQFDGVSTPYMKAREMYFYLKGMELAQKLSKQATDQSDS